MCLEQYYYYKLPAELCQRCFLGLYYHPSMGDNVWTISLHNKKVFHAILCYTCTFHQVFSEKWQNQENTIQKSASRWWCDTIYIKRHWWGKEVGEKVWAFKMDFIFKWFQYAIYTNKNYYEISPACTVWTVFLIIKVLKRVKSHQEELRGQGDSGQEQRPWWRYGSTRSQENF